MQTNRGQQQAAPSGSVAILWDMENCPVPSEVRADDVAGNIRMALRSHSLTHGMVSFFSAYGDFNHFPRKVREGCQRTGVNLIDVPNGKKDASDKAILVDMFLFALDNPPPCTVFLISGDVDFAPALHKLGQRGYTIVLAIPSGVGVSAALCSAGRYVWDWPSVAKGDGLIPARNTSSKVIAEDKMTEIMELTASPSQAPPAGTHSQVPPASTHIDGSELVNGLLEDDIIVWRTSPTQYPIVDNEGIPYSASTPTRIAQRSSPVIEKPIDASRVATSSLDTSTIGNGGTSQSTPAQTKNLHALRDQLLKMVYLSQGKLELVDLPLEYQKQYGKPLASAESGIGGNKMGNLMERLRDWLFVRGEGIGKTVHLTKSGSRLVAKLRRDGKIGKPVLKEEVEGNLIRIDMAGDEDDSSKGEEVVVINPRLESLIDAPNDLNKTQVSGNQMNFEAFISRDEKDSGLQEEKYVELEKDVEVDESTLQQDFKNDDDLDDSDQAFNLKAFRRKLEDILVSHACTRIKMTEIPSLYKHRYSRDLDFSIYGVEDLESLIEKFNDLAVIQNDQENQRCLVALRDK